MRRPPSRQAPSDRLSPTLRIGLTVAALAFVVGACSSAPPKRVATPSRPLRIETGKGCAPSVVGFDGPENPAQSGLRQRLVPGRVIGGLVCRYNALFGGAASLIERGGLAAQHTLTRAEAVQLADEMNAVPVGRAPKVLMGCGGGANRMSVLVFDRSGSGAVNVWLMDTGCQRLSNGLKSLIGVNNSDFGRVIREVDALVPPGRIVK